MSRQLCWYEPAGAADAGDANDKASSVAPEKRANFVLIMFDRSMFFAGATAPVGFKMCVWGRAAV